MIFLIQDVIKYFKDVPEPEFPGSVILEQFQANVSGQTFCSVCYAALIKVNCLESLIMLYFSQADRLGLRINQNKSFAMLGWV